MNEVQIVTEFEAEKIINLDFCEECSGGLDGITRIAIKDMSSQ